MEKLINEMLARRGMTLAELTAQLGYQSKTSLVRVIKNQVSQRALDTFAGKMQEYMDFSDEEKARFDEALEYMRWQEDYQASREMLRFLRGEREEEREVWLEETGSREVSAFSERYSGATDISVTLLNSQYALIFPHLLRLVREKNAKVEHFFQMQPEPVCVIHAINVLIPLIYEKNYAGYASREEIEESRSPCGGMRADAMAISFTDQNGSRCEDLILFDRADHGFLLAGRPENDLRRLLGVRPEEFEPIKRVYFENKGFESYVQFSMDCAELEYNRAIYRIKPDIGIDWIPEVVLINALLEGGIPNVREMTSVIDELYQIYSRRVANTYEKRRVARTIMKRSAMVRFARTGRMSDHFWGLRPFTPEERLCILRLLLEQVRSNPYFNVYFLKDNDFLRDAEIAYYEDVGILVLDSDTDYALSASHSEVMIVHAEFMRMFKEYFERALVAEQVLSDAETVDFLNELIRIVVNL